MKFILILLPILLLTACAQTPEEAAAYRMAGMRMLSASAQMEANNNYSRNPYMYNPATNATQECLHVMANGQCAHYGAPYQP